MTVTPSSASERTREDFALRLLKGSAKKSYEPVVDIDWDAPLAPDKYFIPPKNLSLYGTAMWETMTTEQRIELSRQELGNILSLGIWFENMLNQSLLREMVHASPSANSTYYELTELGDEARHMLMFGKTLERMGIDDAYWPTPRGQRVVNALPLILKGSLLWVAALAGEEIFDSLQRKILDDDDDDVQPMIHRVMRIHVTEEARHIQFARDGIRRDAPSLPRRSRMFIANAHGGAAKMYFDTFTRAKLYRRVGLDPSEAQRQARNNPHFHASLKDGFAPLAAFLTEVDLMGPIARRAWTTRNFL